MSSLTLRQVGDQISFSSLPDQKFIWRSKVANVSRQEEFTREW